MIAALQRSEYFPEEYKRQTQMFFQKNRLDSFKKWVFDDNKKCNATKMAEAGFYSVATKEEPDAVQCFLCSKTLDGWEPNDDPWTEHLSHSKTCHFAKLQKTEDSLTMTEYLELMKIQDQNITDKFLNEIQKKEVDKFEQIMSYLNSMVKKKA